MVGEGDGDTGGRADSGGSIGDGMVVCGNDDGSGCDVVMGGGSDS